LRVVFLCPDVVAEELLRWVAVAMFILQQIEMAQFAHLLPAALLEMLACARVGTRKRSECGLAGWFTRFLSALRFACSSSLCAESCPS
jgi:hypothetical protein